jgi:ketosteroid isomerase-like protein
MRKVAAITGLGLASILLMARAGASPGGVLESDPMVAARAGIALLENEVRAIVDVREQWLRALNCGDVGAALRMYAPGAVLFPDERAPLLGEEAIAGWHERWGHNRARPDVHYDLDARLVRIDRALAVEEWSALVTVTRSADALAISGDVLQFRQSGVRVYRKDESGAWRIDRETFSAEPAAVRELVEPVSD